MAGRRIRHNTTLLPGMPPEQVPVASPLRVHLDLPQERLVWELSAQLRAARGFLPLWPLKPAEVRDGDVVVVRVDKRRARTVADPAAPRAWRKVVALVPDGSDHSLLSAARAGAWAALAEDLAAGELARAVRRVADGECPLLEMVAVRPRVAAAVIEGFRSALAAASRTSPRNPLSTRETFMLKMVADGVTNRDIGERLSLSEQTVKNYLSTIFTKIGARGRAQAAAIAVRRGWLPLE